MKCPCKDCLTFILCKNRFREYIRISMTEVYMVNIFSIFLHFAQIRCPLITKYLYIHNYAFVSKSIFKDHFKTTMILYCPRDERPVCIRVLLRKLRKHKGNNKEALNIDYAAYSEMKNPKRKMFP